MKMLQQILALSSVFILLGGCGNDSPRAAQNDGEPWIGVYIQDIDDEMRDYMGLKENYGILVNDIVKDSPADKAGLEETDIILKFDGNKIRDTRQLTHLVENARIGKNVELEILREKKKKKLDIRIQERPERYYSYDGDWEYDTPKVPGLPEQHNTFHFNFGRPKLGIKMSELNDDLAEYFDVNEDDGVLILSVKKNSPADKGGLRSGDIIHLFDGKRIHDKDDLLDKLSYFEGGDKVEIEIIRKGRDKKVKVELDKNYRGSYHRFNKEEWEKFGRKMKEWGEDMKDWGQNFKHDFHNDNISHDIHLYIPMEDIAEELEHALEILNEEIGAEMKQLNRELEDIHIEIEFNDNKALL